MDGGLIAVAGDRNSAADGLRGICSLALPSRRLGLLGYIGETKLCRWKSVSLVCPRRRKRPCIVGIIGLRLRTH